MTNGEEETELQELSRNIESFFSQIPFNKVLDMHVDYIGHDRVSFKMPMNETLIGNFLHGILHGGAISTALDVAGGGMALVGTFLRTKDLPDQERLSVLAKISTIDLRVDYLRPGRGEWFLATGTLLRIGNKVAVTRMELHNDKEELLAVGTGTYMCG